VQLENFIGSVGIGGLVAEGTHQSPDPAARRFACREGA
jgi:hypothetical protein